MSEPTIELVKLIGKLQKKYEVLKVPSKEEMEFLIDEYGRMRAVELESLTKSEIHERLDRLSYIEAQLRTFKDYHYGMKH